MVRRPGRVNAWRELGRLRGRARRIAGNRRRTGRVARAAFRKASANRPALRGIWRQVMGLIRLVRAWARGDYRQVRFRTIVLAVAALLYFLNPFDVIPDFLGGLGLLDDVTVLTAVLGAVQRDVEQFLLWEQRTGRQGEDERG
ncbi:MAG: YkvA family protein [Planctomycetota bacterium]